MTNHPPSIFVSSTCIDLDEVRNELRLFLKKLGMDPVLSESPSFPVDPDRDAVENCLACVKEKADIFVLVVGWRYGSETENGKSVTHLEYLAAKAKGVPLYVFLQNNIRTSFLMWQTNRSGDFSEIVDSPKLFEFVELLYDPSQKNWIFTYNSAQEIKEALRTQLACLFMDALTIRAKVHRNGLSEALLKELSGAALLLVVQKPFAWEYKLFTQVLSDEISSMGGIKRDLNYGFAVGNAVKLDGLAEIGKWMGGKVSELRTSVESMMVLFNTALPKAFGAPGEPGDVEEIVYVCKRLAEVYRYSLEWSLEFKKIQVEDEFSCLLELSARMPLNMIEEIEAFPVDFKQQIGDAERRYEETKQPQSVEITLRLTCPDMTELNSEFERLQKKFRFR